ncbi:hypothetical protein GGR47_003542 [Sphingomonas aquatilis]|uniref:Uncharacterized protein n=2 Tax=Sphingomonadaceae TaxID=41297 RepID=A0AAW3TZ61_9SPHN|nr:hypothetical protein [Sphingomonas aquatilis]
MIRRSRSAMFGAVLAFLALFGLFAVSGWHNAMVHDDDPIHAVSIEHSHGSSSQTDPDAPVHVLAHATGQWIGFADPFMPVAPLFADQRVWVVDVAPWLHGIAPAELLRPPRG